MNQTTETMAGPNLSSKWSRDLETSLPAVSCLSTVYVTFKFSGQSFCVAQTRPQAMSGCRSEN